MSSAEVLRAQSKTTNCIVPNTSNPSSAKDVLLRMPNGTNRAQVLELIVDCHVRAQDYCS